ncbi:hypothetical protein PV325_009244 [Microctonus aethiopoides]|nr:hypothetical protein PV325_009244 [Microctonus aethiopoides]
MSEEKYSLVLFVEDSQENIDIVPSNWIVHNKSDDNLYCKFINESQPKNIEISKLLRKKVKNLENPDESWKFHRVNVRGRADTWKEAKTKLKKLSVESHVIRHDDVHDLLTECELDLTQALDKDIDFSPINPSQKITVSTRTCLKDDDSVSVHSDTSVESNDDTSKKNQQKNVNDSSSSNEHENNNKTHTDANVKEVEAMSNILEIAQLTTKMTTNTEIEKNRTCCQETTELILKQFRKLSQQLGTLHGLVIEMRNELHQIKKNEFSGRSAHKEKVHNIQIPFTTLYEFETFDNALKDNSSLKSELGDMIWPLIDGTNKLSKSLTNIFMKFFKAEVLHKFTAIKKTGEKKIFKETNFSLCLYEIFVEEYKNKDPVKAEQFYKAIGRVLNNAKDWEHGRKTKKAMD